MYRERVLFQKPPSVQRFYRLQDDIDHKKQRVGSRKRPHLRPAPYCLRPTPDVYSELCFCKFCTISDNWKMIAKGNKKNFILILFHSYIPTPEHSTASLPQQSSRAESIFLITAINFWLCLPASRNTLS